MGELRQVGRQQAGLEESRFLLDHARAHLPPRVARGIEPEVGAPLGKRLVEHLGQAVDLGPGREIGEHGDVLSGKLADSDPRRGLLVDRSQQRRGGGRLMGSRGEDRQPGQSHGQCPGVV